MATFDKQMVSRYRRKVSYDIVRYNQAHNQPQIR